MSRETWSLVKSSKRFYVKTYRAVSTTLLISCFFNILLSIAIYYTYFDRPERDFYSTDGITPPVALTPLDEPNYTSTPLLASSPNTVQQKAIPR